jgi:all-trans-8'-apo-beta-carotenal 15,15'-oxygenase
MTDHAPLIDRAFALDVREQSVELAIEGSLPQIAPGVAYWNGPARFTRGSVQYKNWLDGDGLVCALALDGGRPRVTTRFVRSDKFVQEEAAGRALFRQFGTAFEGDRLKRGIGLESPVNVSVYPFGDAMLAFGEQGLPWAIDPRTLETRGIFTFNNQLNDVTPFSAHPKFDHLTGEMFNFGVSFSADRPMLNIFRFDDGGALVYRKRVPLPYPSSMHDFAVSASYAVFYVSPFILDITALMQGGSTLMDALRWEPQRGSHLLVVSREAGEVVMSLPAGNKYCLHLVNAFESAGNLIVDVVEYDRPIYDQYQVIPSLFENVPPGIPTRITVDVAGARIASRRQLAYSCAPDFPSHDVDLTGRAYADFWMLGIGTTGRPGRKFLNQLVRFNWDSEDVELYQTPPGQYLGGEPLFLRSPSEATSGVVICQSFDAAHTASSFLVFDAFAVSRGPIATLRLPAPVPPLFHSSFLASAQA